MIRVVRRWLPHAAITMLGDQAYRVVELAQACRQLPPCLDAVLQDAPPQRQTGTRGRPCLKGKRQPSLADRLKDAATLWEPLSVLWQAGRVHERQTCSGQPPLPIRRFLGRRHDQPLRAFFSTCPDDRASAYIQHCSIETTVEESCSHLSFETQWQGSDLATERTTPSLLGLYSIVALLAPGL